MSILIPCFNEEKTVGELLRRVFDCSLPNYEVVVVDDGSTDGTQRALERFADRVVLLRHARNVGKGAALRTGLQHARGKVVVIQDADLEYDPRDLESLVQPLEMNQADAAFGYRPRKRDGSYFLNRLVNELLTWLCNYRTGLHLKDVSAGYKVIRREMLSEITLQENGFSCDVELAVKLARLGARISQHPISYQPRSYADGKKIRWPAAVHAAYSLIAYSRA